MAKEQMPGGEAYQHEQGRLERLALRKVQGDAAARAAEEKKAPAAKERFRAHATRREARPGRRELDLRENAAARSDPTVRDLDREEG